MSKNYTMSRETGTETVQYNRYWGLEQEVGTSFNRLKAKIYNLIEASVIEKSQQEAIKGLIKGFSNDEYRLCVKNMRYEAQEAGFIEKEEGNVPDTAQPLEHLPM